jgi:hypothetical protein
MGRRWGKGVEGRMWCKYCVHMYVNGKMISAETLAGMGRGWYEEEWRGAFNYNISDIL